MANNYLVNAYEMSQILKISQKSIYQYVRQGKIPSIRIGRHLRFEPNAVLERLRVETTDCIMGHRLVSTNVAKASRTVDFDALARLVEPKRSLTTEKKVLTPERSKNNGN